MLEKIYDSFNRWGAWFFYILFIKPFSALPNNDGLRKKNIESFLEHRPISAYLNYASIVMEDDIHIHVLKDGRYGVVLRVYMPSFPSDEIENIISSYLRSIEEDIDVVTFNTFASQNLDDQFEAYLNNHPCEVNIKKRHILKQLIYRRYEFLKRGARESIYPKNDFKIRDYVNIISVIFSPSVNTTEEVAMKFEVIKAAFSKYGAHSLDQDKFVAIQREFFFNEKGVDFWNDSSDTYTDVSHQITRGGLKINVEHPNHKDGFVINDETYVSVLTTLKFPKTIDFTEMDALFVDRRGINMQPHIRGPFFAGLVLDYRDNKKVQKQTMARVQRNFDETVKHSARSLKKHPNIKMRKDESREAIEILDQSKERAVPGQWTLVLYDTDLKNLNRSVASIRNSFMLKGWELVPEKFGHIALFNAIHILPLQLNIVIDELLKRKEIKFDRSNHTPIVPWIGDSKGYTSNCQVPLYSRTQQLRWFDPMDSGEGSNIAGTGTTGSGKSYAINDLISQLLGSNFMCRLIDSLPSYKNTAEYLGGQYEDFSKQSFCLNFFTDIMLKRDENDEVIYYVSSDGTKHPYISDDDYNTIIPMIGAMVNLRLHSTKSENKSSSDAVMESYLASVFEDAVRASFESKRHDAGMREVYEYVEKKYLEEKEKGNQQEASWVNSCHQSLKRFGDKEGMYYPYFNGVNNININSDFTVWELTAVEQKGILYPLTLMAIANKVAAEFFDMKNRNRPKILIIEEFWKYLHIPVVLVFALELSRKVRKAGGIFMPNTQNIDDYFVNSDMEAIYNNCAWKYFLKNSPSSIDRAMKEHKLSLSQYAANLLKGIDKKDGLYGELAIMKDGFMEISRFRVDGVSHYLFSTSPKDHIKIKNKADELECDYGDAIIYLGIERDNPDWDKDRILAESGLASEEDIKKNKELKERHKKEIEEATKKAHSLENYIITKRELYSKNNIGNFTLIEFAIKGSYYEKIEYDDYVSDMMRLEIDSDMSVSMINKILLPEYLSMENIGFIVPLRTLIDNQLYVEVKSKWVSKKYSHITLLVSTIGESLESIDLSIIEQSLLRFKELGFKIGFYKYNYETRNKKVRLINPSIILIDAIESENQDNHLEQTINLAKVFSSSVALLNANKIKESILAIDEIEYIDVKWIKRDDENVLVKNIDSNENSINNTVVLTSRGGET